MSLDYCVNHNSPAEVENFEDHIITRCIFWTFISFLILPICTHYWHHINKFQMILQVFRHFHCIWNYFAQLFNLFLGLYYIKKEFKQLYVSDKNMPQQLVVQQVLPKTPPPLEESIHLITEQLILYPATDNPSPLWEIHYRNITNRGH